MENHNYDFPYHDFHVFDDGDEPTLYVVGTDNQLGRGTQHKKFMSKSTLLIATATTTIRFNSSENVTITLIANVPYTFVSNIHTLYVVAIGTDGALYAYFEGVHPNEARRPE